MADKEGRRLNCRPGVGHGYRSARRLGTARVYMFPASRFEGALKAGV